MEDLFDKIYEAGKKALVLASITYVAGMIGVYTFVEGKAVHLRRMNPESGIEIKCGNVLEPCNFLRDNLQIIRKSDEIKENKKLNLHYIGGFPTIG